MKQFQKFLPLLIGLLCVLSLVRGLTQKPFAKDSFDLAGFGRLEIMPPSVTKGYDKKRLDQLVLDLAADAPELAALIAQCRTESARAGGLRIIREKR